MAHEACIIFQRTLVGRPTDTSTTHSTRPIWTRDTGDRVVERSCRLPCSSVRDEQIIVVHTSWAWKVGQARMMFVELRDKMLARAGLLGGPCSIVDGPLTTLST